MKSRSFGASSTLPSHPNYHSIKSFKYQRTKNPTVSHRTPFSPHFTNDKASHPTIASEPCLVGTKGHATRPLANATKTKDIVIQDADATKPVRHFPAFNIFGFGKDNSLLHTSKVQGDGRVVRVRNQKGFAGPRNVHAIRHISSVIPRYASLADQGTCFEFIYAMNLWHDPFD